jgi:hypothetical protein
MIWANQIYWDMLGEMRSKENALGFIHLGSFSSLRILVKYIDL